MSGARQRQWELGGLASFLPGHLHAQVLSSGPLGGRQRPQGDHSQVPRQKPGTRAIPANFSAVDLAARGLLH